LLLLEGPSSRRPSSQATDPALADHQ
jgi:hypothetical protein